MLSQNVTIIEHCIKLQRFCYIHSIAAAASEFYEMSGEQLQDFTYNFYFKTTDTGSGDK